jgi:phosphoribosylformylglycinamidine cyclo-ligase
VIVVPEQQADKAIEILNDNGEQAWQIGEMVSREADAVVYR